MRQPVLYPPHFQIVLILGTQPKGPLLLEALPDSLLIPFRSVWEVLGQVGCMGLTHSQLSAPMAGLCVGHVRTVLLK